VLPRGGTAVVLLHCYSTSRGSRPATDNNDTDDNNNNLQPGGTAATR